MTQKERIREIQEMREAQQQLDRTSKIFTMRLSELQKDCTHTDERGKSAMSGYPYEQCRYCDFYI